VFVSKPSRDGYARAKFVGGGGRSARLNAQALASSWMSWSHHTRECLHVTVNVLD
jgi:hypothetical protein